MGWLPKIKISVTFIRPLRRPQVGLISERPVRPVLDDVFRTFGPDEDRLWFSDILARLATEYPEVYGEWDLWQLRGELRPYGLGPVHVARKPDGQIQVRMGVFHQDVADAAHKAA